MTELPQKHQLRRGRIFPELKIPPEELAKRQAKREELGRRCRQIFEEIRPQLIDQYYNWFIAIDPDNGNYLLDPKLEGLVAKIRHQYSNQEPRVGIFRLNESGACGRI